MVEEKRRQKVISLLGSFWKEKFFSVMFSKEELFFVILIEKYAI